jgi:hypothetical protein
MIWAVCTIDEGHIGTFRTKAKAYAALPLFNPVGRKLPSGVYEVKDRTNDQPVGNTFFVGKPENLACEGWPHEPREPTRLDEG